MSANIIISNDSMNNSSRILASKSNENGLSTIFSYNGCDITFKTENGITYVNATEMAKPFKKRPNDYLSLSSVNELINAITRKYGNADFQPVTIIRGTVNPGHGCVRIWLWISLSGLALILGCGVWIGLKSFSLQVNA